MKEELGPCSCQDSGKCRYVDGGPACMNERSESRSVSVSRSLAERTFSMFHSVDPWGSIAQEWKAALDATPSESRSPEAWIALKDHRPEGREEVLTCSEGRYVSTRGASWVRALWDEAVRENIECAITHWKPMPEAPK